MRTFIRKPGASEQYACAHGARARLGQSAEGHSVPYVQRATGNQGVQRLLHGFSGMRVATADLHEQEADRIAEEALHPAGPGEDRRLRTRGLEASDAAMAPAPPAVHETLRSPGEPLEAKARAFFEPLFGRDLSQVRVHTGGSAAQSARAIDAAAYTAGTEIVFGPGKYAPETAEGKRLLAHELAHVQQQSSSVPGGAPPVVQRQPAGSSAGPGSGRWADWFRFPLSPGSPATSPGYEEAAQAPSFRVRIVAHASPRWRGALDTADAERRNLELSRRRADAVRFAVESLLASHLGAGASVSIDVAVEEQDPGTVGVQAEARGSRETLPEAGGERSDNALQRRRVEVIIESGQRIAGSAGASRPVLTVPTASRFWHVSILMSAGATAGAAVKLLTLRLTNDMSGHSLNGTVWASGGGPGLSLGASASIWGDPSGFYTDRRVNFSDFEGKSVLYTSASISPILGYEWAQLSFYGLGSGAEAIDVGGWTLGSVGLGTSVVYGELSLDKPYPPEHRVIKDSDRTVVLYERTERGEDVHRVLFETGSAALAGPEAGILDSFIASVVESRQE
jgi:hypothetical protein